MYSSIAVNKHKQSHKIHLFFLCVKSTLFFLKGPISFTFSRRKFNKCPFLLK